MPAGRPPMYSEKLAKEICKRVASGRTLLDVCKDDDMPDRSTIYRWRFEKEEFNDIYTRARQCLVEQWADEVVAISDDKDGDPTRDRLRVDTRKWIACKVAPKLYGDKQTVTHEAPSGFNFIMNPPKED